MSARKGDWEEKEEQVIGMLARLGQADVKRNDALAYDARQRFLEEAAKIRPSAVQPVSPARKARHIEWMNFNFLKKENMRMSTLMTIFVIVSLALGGTGATVYAAQSSLPGDALYGVKVAGEAVESGFTVREQSRLQLALRLTDERIQEMAGLVNGGKNIPEEMGSRWQAQLERALGLSAGMRDPEMEGALEQVREHLREHARVMDGLPADDPVQERVREMIRERLELVEHGLADPEGFRSRMHQGDQDKEGNPWTTGTPTPGSGYGPGTCENCTPEGGKNPWTTGTPTPGSGYGPGYGECETCTPEGERHHWATGTATPGSGYGPGPAHEPEHTQAPGPGPMEPGTGSGGTQQGGGSGEHHDEPGSGSGGGTESGGTESGGAEGGHHEESGGGGHR